MDVKSLKQWLGLVLAVVALFSLVGCAAQPAETPESSQTPLVAPPALRVELDKLLTTEQIGDAIGCAVAAPQLWESGTWAHYTAEDAAVATTVDISMDEVSRSVFDAHAAVYPVKWEVPHLGEVSWWSSDSDELLTYESGVMFSVQVRYGDDTDEDRQLMAARHLGALLLDAALAPVIVTTPYA